MIQHSAFNFNNADVTKAGSDVPMYTYTCTTCQAEQEHLVRYDDRNDPQPCECGGKQKRRGLETFTFGPPEYQMAGITADGRHIPGHFAKDAKRRRRKKNG